MKSKRLLSIALVAMLTASGCSSTASTATSTSNTSGSASSSAETAVASSATESKVTKQEISADEIDAMSDEDFYLFARKTVLYYVAFTPESYEPFATAWINLDLMPTVDENIEAIKNGDTDTMEKLNTLRDTCKALVQTADYDAVTINIWGDQEAPIPGGEDPDHYSDAQACLADDPDFQPFISDYRLDDPSSAKGTVIIVPSVRSGAYSETAAIAGIFNDMGYNAFPVEGRMDTIGDIGYAELNLDAQRAIRYVRYHADDLGIDASKIITLAGSKGNFSHPLAFNHFDETPNEYIESLGSTLDDYTPDDIDKEYSNVALMCVDYGSAGLAGFGNTFTEDTITSSKIYSKENYEKGLKFPDILIMTGNLDGDTLNDPAVITGLYNYNQLEDKLYTINYEVHIFNGVAHGFGAGLQYPNLTAQWNEVGIYIDSVLNPADSAE